MGSGLPVRNRQQGIPVRRDPILIAGDMILSQQVYECMLILEPNRYARDASGVSKRIGEMIEKCGGEVLVSRLWADQKLAYPIKGHKKGIYWVTYFRLDGNRQTELSRATQLNNDVLRPWSSNWTRGSRGSWSSMLDRRNPRRRWRRAIARPVATVRTGNPAGKRFPSTTKKNEQGSRPLRLVPAMAIRYTCH